MSHKNRQFEEIYLWFGQPFQLHGLRSVLNHDLSPVLRFTRMYSRDILNADHASDHGLVFPLIQLMLRNESIPPRLFYDCLIWLLEKSPRNQQQQRNMHLHFFLNISSYGPFIQVTRIAGDNALFLDYWNSFRY